MVDADQSQTIKMYHPNRHRTIRYPLSPPVEENPVATYLENHPGKRKGEVDPPTISLPPVHPPCVGVSSAAGHFQARYMIVTIRASSKMEPKIQYAHVSPAR